MSRSESKQTYMSHTKKDINCYPPPGGKSVYTLRFTVFWVPKLERWLSKSTSIIKVAKENENKQKNNNKMNRKHTKKLKNEWKCIGKKKEEEERKKKTSKIARELKKWILICSEPMAFWRSLHWTMIKGPEGRKAYEPYSRHLLVLGPWTLEEWLVRKHGNWSGPQSRAKLRQGFIVVRGGVVLRQGSGVGRPLKGRG